MADYNPDIIPNDAVVVYYEHDKPKALYADLGKYIVEKDKRRLIVKDATEAIDGYLLKFGQPAPNPLAIIFTPDKNHNEPVTNSLLDQLPIERAEQILQAAGRILSAIAHG
jgi:hypothetical protein